MDRRILFAGRTRQELQEETTSWSGTTHRDVFGDKVAGGVWEERQRSLSVSVQYQEHLGRKAGGRRLTSLPDLLAFKCDPHRHPRGIESAVRYSLQPLQAARPRGTSHKLRDFFQFPLQLHLLVSLNAHEKQVVDRLAATPSVG
eukprot:549750-Hanusia_phi.AAC.3